MVKRKGDIMTVWQKVAAGTSLSKDGVSAWLTKYKIKACELEEEVHYTGKSICCSRQCESCLVQYLATELDNQEFEQLSLF